MRQRGAGVRISNTFVTYPDPSSTPAPQRHPWGRRPGCMRHVGTCLCQRGASGKDWMSEFVGSQSTSS
jgi:hypothetical protein